MIKRDSVLMLLASFLIAIGTRIALAPAIATTKEQIFDAKLEFRNLPEHLTVVGENLTIEMKAVGTGQQLDQLEKATVTGVVDLSFAKSGLRRYFVEVQAPTRTRVSISPRFPRVWLDIQRVSSLRKEVVVEPSGQTVREFVYEGASILPDRVTLVGPESSLPKVKVAKVSLELNQVRPGSTVLLPVEVVDETNRRVPYVYAQPGEVSVSPVVVAAPAVKRVLISPVFEGQPAFGHRVLSVEVKPTQLEVRGESALISRVSTIETESIKLDGARKDAVFRCKVKLPPGLRATDSDEVVVTVKVGPGGR